MNFDYNEEQQLLAASVAALRREATTTSKRARRSSRRPDGYSASVWTALAEIGLLGLPLPADAGGFGGGAVRLDAVMEAIGDALVVEPYLSTMVLGARFVARAGSAAQQQALLPLVAAGDLKMAFAQSEERRALRPRACRDPRRAKGGDRLRARRRQVASCCMRRAPISSSSRRAPPAAMRDRDGHQPVRRRRARTGRHDDARTEPSTACAPPTSALDGVRVDADALLGARGRARCR